MSFGDGFLAAAAGGSAEVARNLAQAADRPVSEVLGKLQGDHAAGLQPRTDVVQVLQALTARLYGAEVADRVARSVAVRPILSTSNHFGIDTLAVSVQCTLLFALGERARGGAGWTAIVLGCGSVSMDSASYPLGVLMYDQRRGQRTPLTTRVAVLPNRVRRMMAGAADPWDEVTLGRALDRVAALGQAGTVSAFCATAATKSLTEDFGDPQVLALSSYADQSTAVNQRLWSKMAPATAPAVRVVQLRLEEVVAELAGRDVADPTSLLYRLLFGKLVRDRLIALLDGEQACWRVAALQARVDDPGLPEHGGSGTVLFWGATEDGHRIPLGIEQRGSEAYLVGVDGRRSRHEWLLSPDSIAQALAGGRLVPALTTCFTVLAFARGLTCVGGPYQSRYLPVMQDAVAEAIGIEDPAAAAQIRRVCTNCCIADLNVAIRITADGLGLPMGPLELAAAGGFSDQDVEQILHRLPVRQAYLAAFPEVLDDLVPSGLPADWFEQLISGNPAGCPDVIRFGSSLE